MRPQAETARPPIRQSCGASVGDPIPELGDKDIEHLYVSNRVGVAYNRHLQVASVPTPLGCKEVLVAIRAEDSVHLRRADVALMDSTQMWPGSHDFLRQGRIEAICRP